MTTEPAEAPGRRAHNREKRRRAIMEAAARILVEHGADGLVIRKLADAADTTPRTIYVIFGSKEGLLRAMFSDLSGLPHSFMINEDDHLSDILAKLGSFLDKIAGQVDIMRPLVFALQYAGLNAERVAMEDEMVAVLKASLDSSITSGELSNLTTSSHVAHQLVMTLIQGLRRWSQRGMPDMALRPFTLYGMTLLLIGAATEEGRRSLQPALKNYQAELDELFAD